MEVNAMGHLAMESYYGQIQITTLLSNRGM